jgi:hypothetical protein
MSVEPYLRVSSHESPVLSRSALPHIHAHLLPRTLKHALVGTTVMTGFKVVTMQGMDSAACAHVAKLVNRL